MLSGSFFAMIQKGATMLTNVLISLAILIVVAVGFICIQYWRFSSDISNQVSRIKQTAQPHDQIITEGMLANLPEPAQRYFVHAGIVGTAIPRTIEVHQRGKIRQSAESDWLQLEAIETYSTNPPSFVWQAWFPRKLIPMVIGRDAYGDGKASILMKMLATFTIADEHGPELKHAGLLRYLNEIMWFPAAYLAPNVQISPAGENSFSVAIADAGETAEATIEVDSAGRFINFCAHRFNTNTRSLEAWETPMLSEKNFNGFLLPNKGSAAWVFQDQTFEYITLEIDNILHTS